jgi:hypothetical protein
MLYFISWNWGLFDIIWIKRITTATIKL